MAIFFLGLCDAGSGAAIAAGNYRFQAEALTLARSIKDPLIRHGVCASADQCISKKIVFVTSESWGLNVEVYGVTDADVLHEIIGAISMMALKTDAMQQARFSAYAVSKDEALAAPIFRLQTPVVKFTLEKKNAKH